VPVRAYQRTGSNSRTTGKYGKGLHPSFPLFIFFISYPSRAGAGRKPACLWACIIYHLILNFAPVGHLRVKIFTLS